MSKRSSLGSESEFLTGDGPGAPISRSSSSSETPNSRTGLDGGPWASKSSTEGRDDSPLDEPDATPVEEYEDECVEDFGDAPDSWGADDKVVATADRRNDGDRSAIC